MYNLNRSQMMGTLAIRMLFKKIFCFGWCLLQLFFQKTCLQSQRYAQQISATDEKLRTKII